MLLYGDILANIATQRVRVLGGLILKIARARRLRGGVYIASFAKTLDIMISRLARHRCLVSM
jgi:hypothetical protein